MENGHLQVETLGPLRARVGGRELSLGAPKQRAVFAVLALRADSSVTRDDLIDQVWGESAPATAAGSLHTYVSGLRRALAGLGEPLTSSGSGYMLHLAPAALDTAVVERLSTRARLLRARRDQAGAVDALDEALGHWRPGSALGGLPGPFAAEHSAWADDLRLRLVLERAELLLELGRPTVAADQLRARLPDHPYHEHLRALLVTALHRSGRTADALNQYHSLRTLLSDDLGIDPSAELQALYTSILTENSRGPGSTTPPYLVPTGPVTHAVVAGPVRPAQLPHGVGVFVGRRAAVQEVTDAARSESAESVTGRGTGPRIVMIVGVGGVGKTALAAHCVERLAPDYPDGQVYVNLHGFGPRGRASSTDDALHHLLTSVGAAVIPADREDRVSLWRSIVRDRRMLVLLDNAESAQQVEDLLPGGGSSFTLVTSRNRLSGLAVRYSARRVTVSPFTPEESQDLLRRAFGGARVGAEPAAARRLADLCGHLPLALRIASERVTSAGPWSRITDLVAELEDVRRRLDTLQLPEDELSSVRGILSWSYAGLGPETARAFRTLGLLPGRAIRLQTAAALLDVTPAAAAAALGSLAAQHLVEAVAGGYRMHDLTRIYAEELSRGVGTPASRRAALERVLRWYVGTLTPDHGCADGVPPFVADLGTGPEPLRFADRKALVDWCARERDNVDPLLLTAQRLGCHEQVWRLAYLLSDYFSVAGQAVEWVDTLRIGLRSAEMTGNQRAQVLLLDRLGTAETRSGRYGQAVQGLERGLRLADSLGDPGLRAGLLSTLASALRETKDHQAALDHARQALELAHRAAEPAASEAGCLAVLCAVHAELGEFEESLRHGLGGLRAARRAGDPRLEADILITLGVAEQGLAHDEGALGRFRQALSVCEAGGDRYHEALALFGLARLHRDGSRRRPARGLATRAMVRLKELNAGELVEVRKFLRALDADRPAAGAAPLRRAG
ncbi:DNA-binding SARP family transcriptional activator [Streptacidiphilus sp. MAP12-33]|uniref:AfsR/SARP family transcriptional regulator n=1 Tax=Streptacidiphilus sp. MAP12-33 TaxID=3156266 RepID=UPI003516CEE4